MNFIENETPEKLRGGYYTSQDITQFLVRWVGEIAPQRLLEPSCGDGAFLRGLANCPLSTLREVLACEVVPEEAAKARAQALGITGVTTTISEEDFLGWALPKLNRPPSFDAVVGNPPFIRYQYLTNTLQDRAEAVFRAFGLPFTRHTNAWVPFIIASMALLRPGGRLAMVVPAELLHVLHAQSLRSFLSRTCKKLLILDPEELLFQETLQGVVLLLAEKTDGNTATTASLAVSRLRGRSFLHEPPAKYFRNASYLPSDELGAKWTTAFLTSSERHLLKRLRANRLAVPFQEIGRVAVGIVTGANKFFLVADETVRRFSLEDFAYPMFGRSEHVPGILYDARTHRHNKRLGYPTNFLWFEEVAKSKLPSGPRSYIDKGESESLHRRYKCRIRSPWYSVPSVFATPIGMLKRSHDYPRLVLNTLGAFTTDTAYRVAPTNGIASRQLVYSFVNSLTALSAELEGRHYGGGVLELVPSEINRLLVPYLPKLRPDCKRLDTMFRNGVSSAQILAAQDPKILQPLGLRASDCDSLRAAWLRLKSRRQRVSETPRPSS